MSNTKLPARLLDTSAIPTLNVTGDLTVDTTTLKVDTTNNRVGIGIASPSRKLHIKDNGQIKLENTGTSAWAGLDIHTSVGTNNYDMYMGMLDSNGRFFIDVNSNGEDLTILQDGNVGIGNTAPSDYYSAFDNLVIGTTGANGLTIVSSTNQVGTVAFADGTTGDQAYRGYAQYDHTTDKLLLGTAGSNRLEIDSSGNVDIGGNVTAPNLINIATHAVKQNTTAREFMSIKNTGTGTGDYLEIKLFNDNDDYTVLGTIGSNYNSADWAGSSYLYSNRQLRIKSSNEIKFYTGGFTHPTNLRLTVDSGGSIVQQDSMVAGSSGNKALIKPKSSAATTDTAAAIAIQQATTEGDTIIFADYDPYVEYGISALNATDELIFTAGTASNAVTGRSNRTYYNNAGSTRTAYTKFYFNLHSADLGLGGDIVPNAGHGINFGNSSPSPNGSTSANSNILDDYEEGTWTPTLINGGTIHATYAATYTKVGRLVHINMYIAMTVPNDNNQFNIGGLPYTPNGGSSNYTTVSMGYYGAGNLQVAQNGIVHATAAYIYIHRADGTSATVKNSMMYANGWSSSNGFIVSGCYVHA